ncbi:SWI/SNF complex component SNF12 homolog [Glycine soja]|uniref:SWI/SNF complex component SNF12 like n=1 Tax=Glycine soja TaxID=3848 RepID=A0A0B2QT86_GLYSO|nr:SWI/SNF complex component SNF12 homolog [Glycine soja]KHN23284.1 SWI/SNF complex component SNF12 like [Glycine soja]RZC07962.1 SWI/SNF complex component SNF12-like isoform A [Glycine soja]RZC07963.1 SWI/SNF complex component SNF12-like isoform B [Glycine soja]
MNNQAKNIATSSLFGHSGMAPQPQPHHPNPIQQWNHPNPLLSQSQSHPQTQFHGLFQFSEPQSQVFAQAQYAQAQLQSQAARAHPQVPQTLPFAHLHNLKTNTANGVSSLGTGSAKRATLKPPLRSHNSLNMNQSTPFKATELTPAVLQKKQIPEKVAALLPESALYTQLLDFEAQVDASLARRKIDIQETKLPPHVQKTLRVYVFNTFSNHAKMDADNRKADDESWWSLKIIGRILEDGVDSMSGISQGSSPLYPKFSAFFKKITILLDQSLYPDNHVTVWDSARSPTQQDGFEVKRKGNKEFTAVIAIEMNYTPDKFMVSPPLSKLLGIEVETRPRIIATLSNYVKSRKLQIPNDPSFFICDPSLQMVFGEEKMDFTMVSQKLAQHLTQPQPIHMEHNIKLSGHSPAVSACYDIQVDVPFPLEKDMSTFLAGFESQKEIEAYDEAIRTSLKKIQEHHRRRAFFLSFSQSPAEFIDTLIASQSKDLKLVAGDASHNVQKELPSEFFNQPWVEDAVIRYLNRKSAGSDAHGHN